MKCEVLDHGYVEFIESWGTGKAGMIFDGSSQSERGTLEHAAECSAGDGGHLVRRDCEVGIIEAARQSTQKGFTCWTPMPCNCKPTDLPTKCRPDCDSVKYPGDSKLLKFLYDQHHDSPFEFAGMVIEVQAPIFVFREWHRHRTQSYNEMSARYTPLPDLYYQPPHDRVQARAQRAWETRNKQAASVAPPNPDAIGFWLEEGVAIDNLLEDYYKRGLSIGVPKELARIRMPVGHYTRMRAHANLRNWLAFMTLRCDPDAQWEIRQFAWAVSEFIGRTFPLTHALWASRMNAIHP